MEHEQKTIRYQSKTHERLTSLINRVNVESLKMAHKKQKAGKAVGIDGESKEGYSTNLEQNLNNLIERMKRFQYIPKPVRRTYIPKANGSKRPLGIPSYEDRLVQSVMADILNEIYEPRFLECSYGFRPERSAHDVVRIINEAVMHKKVNYVLEADIKGFFDNLDQNWLMKFLEHDIADKNFLRYIGRFLKAGVMEGTELQDSDRGTPQGGLISPVLANVYLHYVLDQWYELGLKKHLRGEVYYVRYADDFLLMFQYENEARMVMELLRKRLSKFGLELAEDKTRILSFGKYARSKEEFDFLGFTFFNTKSHRGWYRIGVRTSKKKLKAKRLVVKAWLRTRLTSPIADTMRLINACLIGHANYYCVNGNFKAVQNFWLYVRESTYNMLNRRDQKGRLRWEQFNRIWDFYVQKPRITVDIWHYEPKLI